MGVKRRIENSLWLVEKWQENWTVYASWTTILKSSLNSHVYWDTMYNSLIVKGRFVYVKCTSYMIYLFHVYCVIYNLTLFESISRKSRKSHPVLCSPKSTNLGLNDLNYKYGLTEIILGYLSDQNIKPFTFNSNQIQKIAIVKYKSLI